MGGETERGGEGEEKKCEREKRRQETVCCMESLYFIYPGCNKEFRRQAQC
jgi:hypothetical protein